jgi:hypothetical protein
VFRVPERRARIAALPGDHAEEVVGVRLPRPGRRHPPVQALGPGEVASAVTGHAFFQQCIRGLRRHVGTLGRWLAAGNVFTPRSRMRSCDNETLLCMIASEPFFASRGGP